MPKPSLTPTQKIEFAVWANAQRDTLTGKTRRQVIEICQEKKGFRPSPETVKRVADTLHIELKVKRPLPCIPPDSEEHQSAKDLQQLVRENGVLHHEVTSLKAKIKVIVAATDAKLKQLTDRVSSLEHRHEIVTDANSGLREEYQAWQKQVDKKLATYSPEKFADIENHFVEIREDHHGNRTDLGDIQNRIKEMSQKQSTRDIDRRQEIRNNTNAISKLQERTALLLEAFEAAKFESEKEPNEGENGKSRGWLANFYAGETNGSGQK